MRYLQKLTRKDKDVDYVLCAIYMLYHTIKPWTSFD